MIGGLERGDSRCHSTLLLFVHVEPQGCFLPVTAFVLVIVPVYYRLYDFVVAAIRGTAVAPLSFCCVKLQSLSLILIHIFLVNVRAKLFRLSRYGIDKDH